MALADCDQALMLLPLSIAARETRGFIFLNLGDPAIAITEYEAALQMDANRPLALYGWVSPRFAWAVRTRAKPTKPRLWCTIR
jgi:hypothetical protein